jgi:primosomal protein N' (replication factor Y)
VPREWESSVRVGTIVKITLHNRRVKGWVVKDDVSAPEGVELLPILSVSSLGPPIAILELTRWAAWRWAGTQVAFLRMASPKRVVRSTSTLNESSPEAVVASSGRANDTQSKGVFKEATDLARSHPGQPLLVKVPPSMDLIELVEFAVFESQRTPKNGSVLVLVPSKGWAERLCKRLVKRGFRATREWEQALAGWPVVVGSRAAAWAPIERVAAAVVVDAHDGAYRSERAPTFNAVDVVVRRAELDGAPCWLTSPCPTPELVVRFRQWSPDRSIEGSGWPKLVVVDRRGEDPRTGLISEELVALARDVLERGSRAVFVLNRTGRARLIACGSCGELARCERCGSALIQEVDLYKCRRCETERPPLCSACGSTKMKTLRSGVSKVRDELEALLKVRVDEITRDSRPLRPSDPPRERDSGSKYPRHQEHAVAVVGTEAVLHRTRDAGLVAFLDFDQHLLRPEIGASHEALSLIARAGRLVGARRSVASLSSDSHSHPRDNGVVLVQTRIPEHDVILAAERGDPGPLARSEIELRRELSLPPFCAFASLSGSGAPPYAESLIAAGCRDVEVSDLGAGRWLVRSPRHAELLDTLAAVPRPSERTRVEVDPVRI